MSYTNRPLPPPEFMNRRERRREAAIGHFLSEAEERRQSAPEPRYEASGSELCDEQDCTSQAGVSNPPWLPGIGYSHQKPAGDTYEGSGKFDYFDHSTGERKR